MNVAVRRFALPLVAVFVLALVVVVAFGTMTELLLGNWEAGRLFPFSNAHLLEEAAEGLYAPLSDPLFVLFSFAVAIGAFGLSMFWGVVGASKTESFVVWSAALTAVALLGLHLRSAFSPDASVPISMAALCVLAACLAASGAAIWLGLGRTSKSAGHG